MAGQQCAGFLRLFGLAVCEYEPCRRAQHTEQGEYEQRPEPAYEEHEGAHTQHDQQLVGYVLFVIFPVHNFPFLRK